MLMCQGWGSEQVSAVSCRAGPCCPLVLLAPSLQTTAWPAGSISSLRAAGTGTALLLGGMLGTGGKRAEAGFPFLAYHKASRWSWRPPGLMALARHRLRHSRVSTGMFVCVAPLWWVYCSFKITCLIHHCNGWQYQSIVSSLEAAP